MLGGRPLGRLSIYTLGMSEMASEVRTVSTNKDVAREAARDTSMNIAGDRPEIAFPISDIRFDDNGLVPAVIQDARSLAVLMLGFMNRDALLRTIAEGRVCFWSRSRRQFWLKGETSGMFLMVRSIRVNCENNSLLIIVDPRGPTCHTGHESCYFREASDEGWREIAAVITPPEEIYGQR